MILFPKKEKFLAQALLGIVVLLVMVAFLTGCGGGTTVVSPAPEQPPIEYRLILMDHVYGGKIDTAITIEKSVETWYWVRLEYRRGNDPWSVVTEGFTLNVTILGYPSGYWMVDIGLTGGQFRVKAAEYRLEFQPPDDAHLGTVRIRLTVPEVDKSLEIDVTLVEGDNIPDSPPSFSSCRELHPTREAIGDYWWDCVGGEWVNTGELVDPQPPPTDRYQLRSFPSSSSLELGEGEAFLFKVWDDQAQAFVKDVEGSELSSWVASPEYLGEEYSVATPGTFVTWRDTGPPNYVVESYVTPGDYIVTAMYAYLGEELEVDISIHVDFMS